MWQQLLTQIQQGDIKSLARAISLVENEYDGYYEFLENLPPSKTPVVGLTGPPGAGKSTLADALIGECVANNKKVGVVCVDPSSPFNLGALLGDRIRMSQWYRNPSVYIRSLATRGSLGGLHPKIIEITDILKAAPFDLVIVETVGVGQSEIEIAGLADTTVVVVVPEAGDDVQTMKAGLMEIADIFVVNKADRPDADRLVHNLKQMLLPAFHKQDIEVPVLKTVSTAQMGITELFNKINWHNGVAKQQNRKSWLLAEKAWHLVQQHKMKDFDKKEMKLEIDAARQLNMHFNLYSFIKKWLQ